MLRDFLAAHAVEIGRVAVVLAWLIGAAIAVAVMGAMVTAMADTSIAVAARTVLAFMGAVAVSYGLRSVPTGSGRHRLKGV